MTVVSNGWYKKNTLETGNYRCYSFWTVVVVWHSIFRVYLMFFRYPITHPSSYHVYHNLIIELLEILFSNIFACQAYRIRICVKDEHITWIYTQQHKLLYGCLDVPESSKVMNKPGVDHQQRAKLCAKRLGFCETETDGRPRKERSKVMKDYWE